MQCVYLSNTYGTSWQANGKRYFFLSLFNKHYEA